MQEDTSKKGLKTAVKDHAKAITKLLQQTASSRHVRDVFRDFVELTACELSNACDLTRRVQRIERCKAIVERYTAEERTSMAKAFAELVQGLEARPCDLLGQVFSGLEIGNSRLGQFFTPYEVSKLMAQVTLPDAAEARAIIAERGFITVGEPAVGAGGMVIALAEHLREQGINYQQHMHVTATDLDPLAAHMAYIQFSLLGIPAIVIEGNTLTLDERDHWVTPLHVYGLWSVKLRRGYALGSPMDPATGTAPNAIADDRQLQLFEEAA